MATTVVKVSLGRYAAKIQDDMSKLDKKVIRAIRKTSGDAIRIIRNRTPKAFGHLKDSTYALTGPDIATVVGGEKANYAAAVEIGARPHVPPLEAIMKWVRLKGIQGLSKRGKIRQVVPSQNHPEYSSRRTAHLVAHDIKSLGFKGNKKRGAKHVGAYTPIDAIEQVARAIQINISRVGIQPTHFVRGSLPEIGEQLNKRITKAME